MLGATMSIVDMFSRKRSSRVQSALRGSATLRRGVMTISVGVRLEDRGRRRVSIGTGLEQPALIDLTDELRQFYKSRKVAVTPKSITRMFDGYAIDGVGEAARHLDGSMRVRLRSEFVIVFTRFEGVRLGSGWGGGVMLATALACYQALGLHQEPITSQMSKWEIA
jgi:hypothetical protein